MGCGPSKSKNESEKISISPSIEVEEGCGPSKSKNESEKISISPSIEVEEEQLRPNRTPEANALDDAADAVIREMRVKIFKTIEVIDEPQQTLEEQKLCIDGALDLGLLSEPTITDNLLRYKKVSLPNNCVASFFNIRQYDGEVLQCSFQNNSNVSVTVHIPAGQIFIPKDKSRTQNLILKSNCEIELMAGSSEVRVLYAFCGNSNFGCSSDKEMELSNFRFNSDVCIDQSKVWQQCRNFRADTRRGECIVTAKDEESGRMIQDRATAQIQVRETIEEKGKPIIINCVRSMKRQLSSKDDLYSIESLKVVEGQLVDSIRDATNDEHEEIVRTFTQTCVVPELINNFGGVVVPNAEASLEVVRSCRSAICAISTGDKNEKPRDQATSLSQALNTLRDIKCEVYFDELVPMVLGGSDYNEDVFESVLQTTSGINSIVETLLNLAEELKPLADPRVQQQGEQSSTEWKNDKRISIVTSLIDSATQLKQELQDLVPESSMVNSIETTWSIPTRNDLMAGGLVLKRMSLHKKARLAIDEISTKNDVRAREDCLRSGFEQWYEDNLLETNLRQGRGGLSRKRSGISRTRNLSYGPGGGLPQLLNDASNMTLNQNMRESTLAEQLNMVKLDCCNGNSPVEAMSTVLSTFQHGFGSGANSIYNEVYGCLNQMLGDYGLFEDFEEGTMLSKDLMGLLISPYLCDKINKGVAALELLLERDGTNMSTDDNELHRQKIEQSIQELEQDIKEANSGLLFSAIFDDRALSNAESYEGVEDSRQTQKRTTYSSVEKLIKKAYRAEANIGGEVELSKKLQKQEVLLIKLSKGDATKTLDEQIEELERERKIFRELSRANEYSKSVAYTKSTQTLQDFQFLLDFVDVPLNNVFEEDDGKCLGPKARQEWITGALQTRKHWADVYNSYDQKYKKGGATFQYTDVKRTRENFNIIVALQEIEDSVSGKKKKRRNSLAARENMIALQEKLNTPGLIAAAGTERIDDVRASLVFAQIDRTLFSQLKNYNEKGVKESTIKVVQCLLILLGFGSENHMLMKRFDSQFRNTVSTWSTVSTKKFRLGFSAVSTWSKCREYLNLQKQCSLDWMLPAFRTTSLEGVDSVLMRKVSRLLHELKDEASGKRQSSVVDTIFHWCELVHNSWKRKQKRGSRQFSQRSLQPLSQRADSLTT